MQHLQQPIGPASCGQTCVAMITGESLSSVVRFFGHERATKIRDIVAALRAFGVVCGDRLKVNRGELPGVAILKVVPWDREGTVGNWHWVVKNGDQVYDPDREVLGSLEEYRITSFLELSLPRFPHVADAQICRQCKGVCCQGHPGLFISPDRFFGLFPECQGAGRAAVRRRLSKHKMELRSLGGILVPGPKGAEDGCVFLGPEGCTLSRDRMPCQCLALVPSLDTILDGEVRCNMPAECGLGVARNNWENVF